MIHYRVEFSEDSGFGVSTNGLKTKVGIQLLEDGKQIRIFLTAEETKKLIDLLNEKLKVISGCKSEAVELTFDEIRVCIKALNSMQTTLTMQSCSRDFGSEEMFEKLLGKLIDVHNKMPH